MGVAEWELGEGWGHSAPRTGVQWGGEYCGAWEFCEPKLGVGSCARWRAGQAREEGGSGWSHRRQMEGPCGISRRAW